MAPTTATSYDAWVESNPLRTWRKAHDWSIMRLASQLRVSMTIIQLWEKGVHLPSDANIAAIERLCGAETVARWAAWWNERPDEG